MRNTANTDTNTDTTSLDTAPWKFKPGKSGNPAGKKKGSLNKTTLAMQALLDGEAEKITRKIIDLALSGDGMALRLCFDRLLPIRKEVPICVTLPPLNHSGDLVAFVSSILASVAEGAITISDGEALCKIAEHQRSNIETFELQRKIENLELALSRR